MRISDWWGCEVWEEFFWGKRAFFSVGMGSPFRPATPFFLAGASSEEMGASISAAGAPPLAGTVPPLLAGASFFGAGAPPFRPATHPEGATTHPREMGAHPDGTGPCLRAGSKCLDGGGTRMIDHGYHRWTRMFFPRSGARSTTGRAPFACGEWRRFTSHQSPVTSHRA